MASATPALYAGIMVSPDMQVLEFNCRMGDRKPSDHDAAEIRSGDPARRRHRWPARSGRAEWDRRTALAVVLAAEGYPDAPKKGAAIGALPATAEDLHIFHAGTAANDGRVTVSGGRVLVTALGDSVHGTDPRLRGRLGHPVRRYAIPPRYRLARALDRSRSGRGVKQRSRMRCACAGARRSRRLPDRILLRLGCRPRQPHALQASHRRQGSQRGLPHRGQLGQAPALCRPPLRRPAGAA